MSIRYVEQGNGVLDRKTGAFIPKDSGNRMWKEYESWKDEGHTPITKSPSQYHSFNEKTGNWSVDYDLAETGMLNEIDFESNVQRDEITSPYPIQELIYGRKLAESEKFKSAGFVPVDGTGYPYVTAERDAMRVIDPGATTKDAAERIIEVAKEFDKEMAEIEKLRREGKEKVKKFKGNFDKMKNSSDNAKKDLNKKDKKDK